MNTRDDIIIPHALKPGDTVGIAAPAGWFDPERFRRGVAAIEAMGLRVMIPNDLFEKNRYMAGTDDHRAGVFNNLIADRGIKAVFCARGGFGSMRMLPLLDMDAICANPKIIAGFSDVSLLLTVIAEKTGMVTFHAPVITSLADAGDMTKAALVEAMTGRKPVEIMVKDGVTVRSGVAQGRVIGGNLASLCHLIGTPWQPGFKAGILFLEETNEPAYRIDRMLSQMHLSGCLDGVAGIVLGSFENCGQPAEIYEIVQEHVPAGIPVVAGMAAGHGPENITLPLGLGATLDADRHVLQYQAPAVVPQDAL
ncbi:MAG: LD-carboxypeptidase [Thermodesulfobacteriota bacterium]|nr:LD-carboxypeptidase [Thermodesulfobacteriota bacterium]